MMNRREFGQSALAALFIARDIYGRPISNGASNAQRAGDTSPCEPAPPRTSDRTGGSVGAAAVTSPIQLSSILWDTNYEAGNLQDWSKTVGSVTSGGNQSDSLVDNQNLEINMSRTIVHWGKCAVQTKIKKAINKTIAIRLLRWRDDAGKTFPAAAYYSTWIYLPHNYVTTAEWWNIFQFKSQRPDASTSDPMLVGNLDGDGTGYRFYFYDCMKKLKYPATTRFAAKRWVHLEAWFQYGVSNGAVKFWQDGTLMISKTGLQTKKTANDKFLVWGIGNYTSNIKGHPDGPGIAEVFFDDSMISTVRRGVAL